MSTSELEKGDAEAGRRIACVALATQDGGRTAVELMLDDFCDALAAYERISSRLVGVKSTGFQATRLTAFNLLQSGTPQRDEEPADGPNVRNKVAHASVSEPASADTLVIALAVNAFQNSAGRATRTGANGTDAFTLATLTDTLTRSARAANLVPGGHVYAIAADADWEPVAALTCLDHLEHACRTPGASWHGGIATGALGLLPRLMHSPRLGAWRRPLSEHIDRLVAAVRMGCTLGELDHLTSPDAHPSIAGSIETVHYRLPHRLYELGFAPRKQG